MTLAAGLLSMSLAIFWYYVLRDLISPAVVFPGTWGAMLIGESVLPAFGYFAIRPVALPLILSGVCAFACAAGVIQLRFRARRPEDRRRVTGKFQLRGNAFAWFCIALHAVFVVLFVKQLLGLGDDISSIAYQVRWRTVHGESVFGPALSNYILAGLFAVPLLAVQRSLGRVSVLLFALSALPWFPVLLVGAGRSGLVQMLLALAFLQAFFGARLLSRGSVAILAFLIAVLVVGAALVGKVSVNPDASLSQRSIPFVVSAIDYAAQGPILFSRYVAGEVGVSKNWSPTRGLCALGSHLGLCRLPSGNLEFHKYAVGQSGNVYSIFFSLFPRFGWLGVLVFCILYGAITAWAYLMAREGSLYALLLSALLFGAAVLSPFTDDFGSGLYNYAKLYVFTVFVHLVFTVRKRNLRALTPSPVEGTIRGRSRT